MTWRKADSGKSRLELVPPRALELVGRVLGQGAQKYAPENWRLCPEPRRYAGAALRHVFAYLAGERDDPETGLPHLAHAVCSLLFLLELELIKPVGEDNLPDE